jgi:hypothetical protein
LRQPQCDLLRNVVGTDQPGGSTIPRVDHDRQSVTRFAAEGKNKPADIPACPLTNVERPDLATSKRSETVVALDKRVDRLGYPQSSTFNYGRLKFPGEKNLAFRKQRVAPRRQWIAVLRIAVRRTTRLGITATSAADGPRCAAEAAVIAARQNWRGRALWLMLAVSACWVVYVFADAANTVSEKSSAFLERSSSAAPRFSSS